MLLCRRGEAAPGPRRGFINSSKFPHISFNSQAEKAQHSVADRGVWRDSRLDVYLAAWSRLGASRLLKDPAAVAAAVSLILVIVAGFAGEPLKPLRKLQAVS